MQGQESKTCPCDFGGILNSPPEPIKPEEVDKLWDVLPERK